MSPSRLARVGLPREEIDGFDIVRAVSKVTLRAGREGVGEGCVSFVSFAAVFGRLPCSITLLACPPDIVRAGARVRASDCEGTVAGRSEAERPSKRIGELKP